MCPAALSSLHVRARTGCAWAASPASALACTQQLVAVPEERKGNPAQGDPTHPHQAPAGTVWRGFKPWFTIQDVPQQGKYFSISVWAGFSPGKVRRWLLNCMGVHIHVQGSRQCCNHQGEGQVHSSQAHMAQGRLCCFFAQRTLPKKNSVFEAWHDPTNQPLGQCGSPMLSPHW